MIIEIEVDKKMPEIRLQKFLAGAGVASRRQCEKYILEGKVKVNDKIVTELGTKVTENDIVKIIIQCQWNLAKLELLQDLI